MKDSPQTKPKVSVVLPAYNEESVIGRVLESLQNQDYQEAFEILVCDNDSQDRTAEIARSFGARVVVEKQKGTRFAYDTAVRSALGEIVLITNADTILPPEWVRKIAEAYADPDVVGVGTQIDFYDAPEWVRAFMKVLSALNPKRGLWGPSMSCRKEVFEKVGGFDHGINTNEDGIFSLLIEKYGKVAFLDDVVALIDGRRYNRGFATSIKEWFTGVGLNSLYIQVSYFLTGEIKSLRKDFGDIRATGQGPEEKKTRFKPSIARQALIKRGRKA